MRLLLALLLTTQLSGCWFVYIPGSLIQEVLGPSKPPVENVDKGR